MQLRSSLFFLKKHFFPPICFDFFLLWHHKGLAGSRAVRISLCDSCFPFYHTRTPLALRPNLLSPSFSAAVVAPSADAHSRNACAVECCSFSATMRAVLSVAEVSSLLHLAVFRPLFVVCGCLTQRIWRSLKALSVVAAVPRLKEDYPRLCVEVRELHFLWDPQASCGFDQPVGLFCL